MRAKVNSISLGGTTNLALMAAIHPGFVPGFETITYVERLRRLLNALHASRQNSREAELAPPVFPDTIGRFGVIRNFRYAIWPRPDANQPAPPTSYLTLNVSFDGGWEPYMRVIYADIGPLLDALLCHCPGYPGSRKASFDDYCRWVRQHEMNEGVFYNDTDWTASDARYMARLERAQREAADAKAADAAAARVNEPPLKVQMGEAFNKVAADPMGTLALPMRTLKGLYRLAPYFPPNNDDHIVLRRFAQFVLRETAALLATINVKLAQAGALPKPSLDPSPLIEPCLADLQAAFPAPANPAQAQQQIEAFKRAWAALDSVKDERDWLLNPAPLPKKEPDRIDYDPARLQDSILNRADPITHGAIVMLRVQHPAQAAKTLAKLKDACGVPKSRNAVRYLVSFTHAGLKALGIPPERLDRLPQEFIEGMEARASVLGDVRGNHPNHWQRPLLAGGAGSEGDKEGEEGESAEGGAAGGRAKRVDLGVVHVFVVLRCIDAQAAKSAPDVLHPKLDKAARALAVQGSGLVLLAMEATRSRRKGTQVRDHFGFVDGLSQPNFMQPLPKPPGGDDVSAGELLLGYRNDRRDNPWPPEKDDLLDDGSFLVVRKLRQRNDHLEAAIDVNQVRGKPLGNPARRELRAKMMGRWQDGTPLLAPGQHWAGNNFSYDADPQGEHCPFQSHVRRANPRDGRDYMPRILRRGMSYGPDHTDASNLGADRGLVFMAFCASIAEQFETLQRWLAGGNSSGVSSAQADPFLGVPQPGEKRTYRYVDSKGTVVRRELGDRAFVELQWGLYLFVPSLEALGSLARLREPTPPASNVVPAPAPAQATTSALEEWRLALEDQDRAPATWDWVRKQSGQQADAKGYGRLIGSLHGVKAVLQDMKAAQYSVHGYAGRMASTMGLNYLGLDPGRGYEEQAAVLNPIVLQVRERDAYVVAREKALKVLAEFPEMPRRKGLATPQPTRRAIDLMRYSELVLADLCTHWFGLPEAAGSVPDNQRLMVRGGRAEGAPDNDKPPRCPAHTYGASRTIFAPHPRPDVVNRGRVQGPMVLEAVRELFKRDPNQLGPLSREIADGLRAGLKGHSATEVQDLIERNVSGMLLGFPPTVHGNFMVTMKRWIEEATLWEHQQSHAEALRGLPAGGDAAARYAFVKAGLRERLMATMRQCPIPEMLWRSEVESGKPVPEADDIDSERRIVLGIRSAMTDPAAPDELMFGGSCDPKSAWKTVHACPGYEMGVGVMLAMLDVLLDAGTLRPTGSPVLLMLYPQA